MKNISQALYNHSNKEIFALFISEHNAGFLCYYTQYPAKMRILGALVIRGIFVSKFLVMLK